MMNSDHFITKVFSLHRLTSSYIIGAGVAFATYLCFGRADGGIFALVISPFLCLYNTLKIFVFVVLAGLLLYIKALNNFWFKRRQVYKITMLLGVVCYIVGTLSANHAYYDLNDQNTAQNYYNYIINPGFAILLFSLCFRPTTNLDKLSANIETQHGEL